jgi:hypothetical protein
MCNNVDDTDEGSLCPLVGVFGEVHHKGYSYMHYVTITFGPHLHLHAQKLSTSFLWSFGMQHPESGHLFCDNCVYTVTGIKNRHVTSLS